MKIIFAVDTLEYLRRGGPDRRAQAWIGSALKIKPILSINREIMPIERVPTAGRAFERMVEHLAACARTAPTCSSSRRSRRTTSPPTGRARERDLRAPPEFVSEIGPVTGAHVGPGLFGVTGLSRPVLGPV